MLFICCPSVAKNIIVFGYYLKNKIFTYNMSNILDEVFTYENNELSVIKKGDDIWFKAKTIAEILEYKNTREAIIDHVDSEDKMTLKDINYRSSKKLPPKNDHTIYINESGLYSLIMRSKMEKAKEFQKWVTK